jgi:hypothetical protein
MTNFFKKFLFTSVIFSVIMTLLSIYLMQFHYKINVSSINQSAINSSDILILGDSRADRQINPKILNKFTNKNCLNIAESSLDLYSLSLRLIKTNLKGKVLIISASSWQINDGSIQDGYFRFEAFNDLNLYKKLKVYGKNISYLKEMLYNDFPRANNKITIGKKDRHLNHGFNNISCKDFDTTNMFLNHPWYKNIKTNGVKAELLGIALANLNKLDCDKIIIYNAPVYSNFIKLALNTRIWKMENDYCNYIKSNIIAENHDKISFYDLRYLDGFEKCDFYDPQHLCEVGSIKFTEKIVSIFKL